MSEEYYVKRLILGAGLSGITAAYYLNDDYLILEKDSTPGGYCRTIHNDKYVWDYAGHFYHFQMDKYKELFLSLVDKDEIIYQKKNTKIFYKNQLVDYPFQANIHELEKGEFIECLCDLYFRNSKKDPENFLGMLYGKFGKAITEKFLRPYNEKLYATDLEKLDKDAMGRFFPYVDFKQVMENIKNKKQKTYNDEFLYLKKGTGYFIDRLFSCIDSSKVKFDDAVDEINLEKKFAKTQSGKKYYYEELINTLPLNEFLKLSNNQSEIALSWNKVLVLNLGFDKASPRYKKEHWVYFPDKDLNFYRIGFYNNILGQEKLSVYVEIGFPKETHNINAEREIQKALNGMKNVGIIDENMKLVDKNIILMDPAYVHISEEEKIKKLVKSFEKQGVYMLGRYGRWTYNSMEDCMKLADDLAEKLENE